MPQATALRQSPPTAQVEGPAEPRVEVEAGHAHQPHDHGAESHSHGGAHSHDHAHRAAGQNGPRQARHPAFSLLRLSLMGRLGIVAVLLAALWAAVLTVLG